ncbi:MAG: hypothetical protein Q8P27_01040 [Candidatus Peregrinibacteria bacterium]|nr:hypothetical protein [Candidatus Peregrinibacteria bacterium]
MPPLISRERIAANSAEGEVIDFESGVTVREYGDAHPGNPWCSFRLEGVDPSAGLAGELIFYGQFPHELRDRVRVRVHSFGDPFRAGNERDVGATDSGGRVIRPNFLVDGIEVLLDGDQVIQAIRQDAYRRLAPYTFS